MYREEKVIREDIKSVLKYLWDRGHMNTTGVSISERISENEILVDQSGTGFRQGLIDGGDLLIIDLDGNLVKDAPNGSKRMAPVNTLIHLEYYKKNPLAKACIHCHAPFSQIFSCKNMSIEPFILQSNILGEVPCIYVDDKQRKEEFFSKNIQIVVPSGLHCRPDVFYTMFEVAKEVSLKLSPRNLELEKHGLAVTHYKHGIFVFGRDIWEAFDNLERVEANARAIIYSKLI